MNDLTEGLATWFVAISSFPGAPTAKSETVHAVCVVDAHTETEAELIAARLCFAMPSDKAYVVDYYSLISFSIYKKMLDGAISHYEDWRGQWEHYQHGYYEPRPKDQKKKDEAAKAKAKAAKKVVTP